MPLRSFAAVTASPPGILIGVLCNLVNVIPLISIVQIIIAIILIAGKIPNFTVIHLIGYEEYPHSDQHHNSQDFD
jgi:hypothetical protein